MRVCGRDEGGWTPASGGKVSGWKVSSDRDRYLRRQRYSCLVRTADGSRGHDACWKECGMCCPNKVDMSPGEVCMSNCQRSVEMGPSGVRVANSSLIRTVMTR
jgi:hypothetical protein